MQGWNKFKYRSTNFDVELITHGKQLVCHAPVHMFPQGCLLSIERPEKHFHLLVAVPFPFPAVAFLPPLTEWASSGVFV
jgi:hypothetical protein